MKRILKSCTALALALSASGQAVAQVKEIGAGEGQCQHHRLGRLYRARRDRQELRLGHGFREGDILQGQL